MGVYELKLKWSGEAGSQPWAKHATMFCRDMECAKGIVKENLECLKMQAQKMVSSGKMDAEAYLQISFATEKELPSLYNGLTKICPDLSVELQYHEVLG